VDRESLIEKALRFIVVARHRGDDGQPALTVGDDPAHRRRPCGSRG
jgi:hypothetical protein